MPKQLRVDRKPGKTDASSPTERPGSSPFDEDLPFQRWQWRVERVSWLVMVAVIATAVAGLLGGGGPLARAGTTGVDGSRVHYARFARQLASTNLDIDIVSSSERQVRIRISDEYLNAMNVRMITPEPASSTLGDRQHIFAFERSMPAGATIRFELEPKAIGTQRGWVAVDGGAPISFAQFIYP